MRIIYYVIIAFLSFETAVQNAVRATSESSTAPNADNHPEPVQSNDTTAPHVDKHPTSVQSNDTVSLIESDLKALIEMRSKETITEIIEILMSKGHSFADIREAVRIDFSTYNASHYPEDEYELVKFMFNAEMGLREVQGLRAKILRLHPAEDRNLSSFNTGILAIGVSKFVSIAAQFCEQEGKRGQLEVVSISSGDGGIEREIAAEYRDRVGHDLNITLLVPDPELNETVNFRLIHDLMKERPHIIGECVLLVVWPEPPGNSDNYDIDALLELKPRAALILYEKTGSSGSNDLCKLLHNKDDDASSRVDPTEFGFFNWMAEYQMNERRERESYYGLDGSYSTEEMAHQKIVSGPISGTSIFRVVKLKRIVDP